MSDQVTMVDIQTARDWIESGKAVVVDVREQHEYDTGHIQGAILRPLSTWDADELPPVPEGKHLLLHCRSANRCGVAAQNLLDTGYEGHINRLAGGMLAWQAAGAPVITDSILLPIYLPIAGLSLNLILLLMLGGGVGFLSGLFGVGGGFLLTPLLILMGVPSPVAVASAANQVVGASVSGVMAHWRRRNVDFRMGFVLAAGGLVGSAIGVQLFSWLRRLGQVDLVIDLSYVLFLGFVGITMLLESIKAMRQARRPPTPHKRHRHRWGNLPFKMRFPRSGLYVSALMPLGVGAVGGILAALMGVGGGFIMVPMMIYLLEMPTSVVVGTSLFQVIFVTASVTFLQSVQTHTVDVVLMLTLLSGGVIGAQLGARFGTRLRAEQTRLLLALLVLAVCVRLLFLLIETPDDLFALT